MAENVKYKRKLRNLLIDRDYQLRYTLVSVVIAGALCAGLGALVIWQTRQANHDFLEQRQKATELFQRQREESSALISQTRDAATRDVKKLLKVATDMLDLQLRDKDAMVREGAKEVKDVIEQDDKKRVARRAEEDHRLAELRKKADTELVAQRKAQDAEANKRRERNEMILIAGIVLFGFVFLVIIFIYNIVITHKVAGPMFKMGRYMDEVRDGKFTEVWNLRKGDQLVDLYSRFQAMHNAVRERVEKDVELLEETLAACKKSGLSEETLAAMESCLAQKKSSLGKDKKEA